MLVTNLIYYNSVRPSETLDYVERVSSKCFTFFKCETFNPVYPTVNASPVQFSLQYLIPEHKQYTSVKLHMLKRVDSKLQKSLSKYTKDKKPILPLSLNKERAGVRLKINSGCRKAY
ncbi:MAG: hypothetical protein KA792_00230 [Bacteroidales bacterium]|nr:hypothetical protein [Bacteroidales bacterium]